MRRKYESIDVVKMYSTLTVDVWRHVLTKCLENGDINRLIALRYGLQSGLSDAVKSGFKNEKLDLWVMKRIKNLETCAKAIIKQKFPMPGDQIVSKTHKGKRVDYIMDAVEAKRKRDRELQNFLMRSNF